MKYLIDIARGTDFDDAIGFIVLFAFLITTLHIIPADPVWICGAAGAGQESRCEVRP